MRRGRPVGPNRGVNLRAGTDGYGTHAPYVAWAMHHAHGRAVGPLMEMGGGFYSTGLMLAMAQHRHVITLEHDGPWADALEEAFGGHPLWTLERMPRDATPEDWVAMMDEHCRPELTVGGDDEHNPDLLPGSPSVLLIDHAPMGARPAVLKILAERENDKNVPDLIVCHDTARREHYKNPAMREWYELAARFPHRRRFTRLDPPTTICSRVHEIPDLDGRGEAA